MPRNDQPDRTKLTFSQAEGLEPLPQPLVLGELSQEVRSLLWRDIYEDMFQTKETDPFIAETYVGEPWLGVLYDMHVEVDHRPADKFGNAFSGNVEKLRTLVMEGPWNEVFDFLQFAMRRRPSPNDLESKVCQAFETGRVAYTVIPDGPTIIPTATPEEGAAITEAFRLLAETGFDGARSHLRAAAEALSAGGCADSVRESIHAVESVACRLNADASTTLKPALDALEERIKMHPALKEGFSKIYGYTSDQDGIRHALFEGDADVDVVDATFMLGACASLVTYLINKARGSGLIEDG